MVMMFLLKNLEFSPKRIGFPRILVKGAVFWGMNAYACLYPKMGSLHGDSQRAKEALIYGKPNQTIPIPNEIPLNSRITELKEPSVIDFHIRNFGY